MANLTNRNAGNVPGRFYVDDSCIDCDLCRSEASEFFQRDDGTGFSIVYRQPVTAAEIALVKEILEKCPSESIGGDGA